MLQITKKLLKEHFTKNRLQFRPEIIVVHIEKEPNLGSKEAIYSEFINAEKSSHYCINKDGSIWQFVKEEDTAWGNGRVHNPSAKKVLEKGNINPNLYSISIEHEVLGYEAKGINELQYQTTAKLIQEICERWLIPLDRKHIIGHREIYSLKTCPGNIDISRLISMAHPFIPAVVYTSPDFNKIKKQKISIIEQLVELYKKLIILLKK
ncbi:MAG: peptidoglycan recognition family protein [Nanoarchaeota archaeon]